MRKYWKTTLEFLYFNLPLILTICDVVKKMFNLKLEHLLYKILLYLIGSIRNKVTYIYFPLLIYWCVLTEFVGKWRNTALGQRTTGIHDWNIQTR